MDTLREANLDWDDIRFFIALAEAGTLAGAARAMKISHVTVSRRLANLERSLGRTLLQRRSDGYHRTPDGETVLVHALEMRRRINEIWEGRTSDGEIGGIVRLSLTRTLSDHFVGPRLAPFVRANPGVIVELSPDSRNVSIARREADLALRLARPTDGEMIARRVATLTFDFFAAAQEPCDVTAFIAFGTDDDDVPEAAWLRRFIDNRPTSVRSSSPRTQMAAAEAGLGVALLPNYLASKNPRLRRTRLTKDMPTREIWLVRPKESEHSTRIRRFVDFLVALFEQEKHWI